MRKPELIKAIRLREELSQREAEDVLAVILEVITDTLAKGEEVKLPGFGAFTAKQRQAREGRNPLTGQSIDIAAHKVVNFKAGKELKDAVKET